MYILFVNGVPALKLSRRSEFPLPQGNEAWKIIDTHGRTVAAYSPAEALAHAWSMMAAGIAPDTKPADCAVCNYFYVTHDANFPYGCRALHFKGRNKPQQTVLDASGEACMAYKPRRKTA